MTERHQDQPRSPCLHSYHISNRGKNPQDCHFRALIDLHLTSDLDDLAKKRYIHPLGHYARSDEKCSQTLSTISAGWDNRAGRPGSSFEVDDVESGDDAARQIEQGDRARGSLRLVVEGGSLGGDQGVVRQVVGGSRNQGELAIIRRVGCGAWGLASIYRQTGWKLIVDVARFVRIS